jgi:hypothetical protein
VEAEHDARPVRALEAHPEHVHGGVQAADAHPEQGEGDRGGPQAVTRAEASQDEPDDRLHPAQHHARPHPLDELLRRHASHAGQDRHRGQEHRQQAVPDAVAVLDGRDAGDEQCEEHALREETDREGGAALPQRERRPHGHRGSVVHERAA